MKMMKLSYLHAFALFCFVLCQCGLGNAASFAQSYYHKDYPGKCYINADLILAGGETRQDPMECAIYRCAGGEHSYASYQSCGKITVSPKCPLVIDTHAPYPLCCTNAFNCDI